MNELLRERRWAPTRFETREVDGGDGTPARMFVGHAAMFGARSEWLRDRWGYGWYEEIDPGFFDDALGSSDIRCLKNHDPNLILGRQVPGRAGNTLRVSVQAGVGLAYECDQGGTTAARDLAEEMLRGDITQSSFSFTIADDKWGETKEGLPLRTLMRAGQLYDVSPVTFPAYPDADSGLRSGLQHLAESRGLPLDEVVAAARANELGKVIGRSKDAPTVIDMDMVTTDTRRATHAAYTANQRLQQLQA